MSFIDFIKKSPLDFGQEEIRYRSYGKIIALDLVGPGNGKNALDVGCHDGFWAEKLKNLGWNMTCLDKKTSYPGAITHDVDLGLPFPDASFDLVWSSEVIAYFTDPAFFASEVRRVLKPGGRYVITTPNNGFWVNGPLKLLGTSLKKLQDQNQKFFFTESEFHALFPEGELCGFFPYLFVKAKISRLVGALSPTFIVTGTK
jgi:SAM-dependent methyltransferase